MCCQSEVGWELETEIFEKFPRCRKCKQRTMIYIIGVYECNVCKEKTEDPRFEINGKDGSIMPICLDCVNSQYNGDVERKVSNKPL